MELDSVLQGHGEGITGLHFTKEGFVSSSIDCSVQIWKQDEQSIWVNSAKMGQVYGNNNAYFGITSDYDHKLIIAWTFTGAVYCWSKEDDWVIKGLFSGHSKKVTDIRWGQKGSLLFSCSKDQTTRVYGLLKESGNQLKIWKELSRAQIHGYDINAIALLKVKEGCPEMVVCGADEKVLRLLETIPHFVNFYNVLTDRELSLNVNEEEEKQILLQKNPKIYLSVMESGQEVLGLMTKNIKEKRTNFYFEDKDQEKAENLTLKQYQIAPTEDFLTTQTLWPETNKLYGHGYEISVVEASECGRTLVSACKSLDKKHSALIFWDLQHFKPEYEVQAHNFTVLDIKLRGDVLLTVSKDRNVGLYR